MSCFADEEELYGRLGGLLEVLTNDDELGPRFASADTVVRYLHHDPEATITVKLASGERPQIEYGSSELEPEVVMEMDADVAHRFWLGEVNVALALSRGQIRASGPVYKILRLVPLTTPAFPIYRQQLIDEGRQDLVAT